MDFKLSREAFLKVLNHVSSIVDTRSTIPILSNIYIKCENNKIEIRSTDMDISIKEFVMALFFTSSTTPVVTTAATLSLPPKNKNLIRG